MNSLEVLKVHNLTKSFSKSYKDRLSGRSFTAVDNVSFTIQKGEVVGLLGPNGAGKTTIIQMLLSVLQPTSGSIHYFGLDLATHRSALLQRVAFASSYVRLPSELSVWTNLDIFAQMYGVPSAIRAERIEKFLKFFGMWNLAYKETGALSAGQMTRVMLAKAFISKPDIVILDEPTASLDPEITEEVRAFIKDQNTTHGTTLLITSHNMEEVSQICSRVLVLKKGTIIANDTPAHLAHTSSRCLVHLTTSMVSTLTHYLTEQQISYTEAAGTVSIVIDESGLAQLLSQLAQKGIMYEQIALDKPSLQDYFLSIARELS